MYRNGVEKAQLRKSIGDTISDLFIVSPQFVEHALLPLVAHSDEALHLLVARSLARCLAYGKESQLFQLVKHWRKDKAIIGMVKNLLNERDSANLSPQSLLNSVLVLVATYAAQYDEPGEINQEWIHILMELTEDAGEPMVQLYFRDYMIPNLIPLHAKRLEPVLIALLHHKNLRWTISRTLASTYPLNPREIGQMLDSWYLKGLENRQLNEPSKTFSQSEAILLTVAITLGALTIYPPDGPLTQKSAWHRIQHIYTLVKNPQAQEEVWKVVVNLSDDSAKRLEQLFAEIDAEEITRVVSMLTETYAEQRANLAGVPDALIKIDGKKNYPVWLKQERMLTKIEEAIYEWIVDTRYSVVRQIAFRALVSFAQRLDIKETEKVKIVREKRRPSQFHRNAKQPRSIIEKTPEQSVEKYYDPDIYLDEIVPKLATKDHPNLYKIIKDLLPEYLSQLKLDRSSVEFVLARRCQDAYLYMPEIASCLSKAREVYQDSANWGVKVSGAIQVWKVLRELNDGQGSVAFIKSLFTLRRKHGVPRIIIQRLIYLVVGIVAICVVLFLVAIYSF